MKRVLAILIMLLPLIYWNKIRLLFTPDGADAARHASGSGLHDEIMRHLANRVSGVEFTEGDFMLISFASLLFFVFVGFFCDALLGERAFGPKVNGALSFLGAAAFVTAWELLAPKGAAGSISTIVLMAALGSVALLLACAAFKRATIAWLDIAASGARPASGLSRSATRLKAVAGRRKI